MSLFNEVNEIKSLRDQYYGNYLNIFLDTNIKDKNKNFYKELLEQIINSNII